MEWLKVFKYKQESQSQFNEVHRIILCVCVCLSVYFGGFLHSLPVFLSCLWLLLWPRGGKEGSKFRHLRQVRRRRSVHQLPGMKFVSSPNWFLCVDVCGCTGGGGYKKMKKNSILSVYIFMESSAEHFKPLYLLCDLCRRVHEGQTNIFDLHIFLLPLQEINFVSPLFAKIKLFWVLCWCNIPLEYDADAESIWKALCHMH